MYCSYIRSLIKLFETILLNLLSKLFNLSEVIFWNIYPYFHSLINLKLSVLCINNFIYLFYLKNFLQINEILQRNGNPSPSIFISSE